MHPNYPGAQSIDMLEKTKKCKRKVKTRKVVSEGQLKYLVVLRGADRSEGGCDAAEYEREVGAGGNLFHKGWSDVVSEDEDDEEEDGVPRKTLVRKRIETYPDLDFAAHCSRPIATGDGMAGFGAVVDKKGVGALFPSVVERAVARRAEGATSSAEHAVEGAASSAPTTVEVQYPRVMHVEANIKFFVKTRFGYAGPFLHENLSHRIEETQKKLSLVQKVKALKSNPRLSSLYALKGYIFFEPASMSCRIGCRAGSVRRRDGPPLGGSENQVGDIAAAKNEAAPRIMPGMIISASSSSSSMLSEKTTQSDVQQEVIAGIRAVAPFSTPLQRSTTSATKSSVASSGITGDDTTAAGCGAASSTVSTPLTPNDASDSAVARTPSREPATSEDEEVPKSMCPSEAMSDGRMAAYVEENSNELLAHYRDAKATTALYLTGGESADSFPASSEGSIAERSRASSGTKVATTTSETAAASAIVDDETCSFQEQREYERSMLNRNHHRGFLTRDARLLDGLDFPIPLDDGGVIQDAGGDVEEGEGKTHASSASVHGLKKASRYVVLPKLWWMTPLTGSLRESPSGKWQSLYDTTFREGRGPLVTGDFGDFFRHQRILMEEDEEASAAQPGDDSGCSRAASSSSTHARGIDANPTTAHNEKKNNNSEKLASFVTSMEQQQPQSKTSPAVKNISTVSAKLQAKADPAASGSSKDGLGPSGGSCKAPVFGGQFTAQHPCESLIPPSCGIPECNIFESVVDLAEHAEAWFERHEDSPLMVAVLDDADIEIQRGIILPRWWDPGMAEGMLLKSKGGYCLIAKLKKFLLFTSNGRISFVRLILAVSCSKALSIQCRNRCNHAISCKS